MSEAGWHGASFRDPSGYIFEQAGDIYRAVGREFGDEYERFMASGLYADLADSGRLVSHEEVAVDSPNGFATHKVLKPERIPFVSYPWEWSFSQLKDAALLTLDVAWAALDRGMVLKDSSAFNVQFVGTRPVFIDTLSFEPYVEGEPWVAYRQFCQHFLAPLLLRAHVHPDLARLSLVNLDGVPLDVATKLLPTRVRMKPSVLMHVDAHGRAQQKYSDSAGTARQVKVSKQASYALLDSLRAAVKGVNWEPAGTEWCEYYDDHNYVDEAMRCKAETVERFLDACGPRVAWDLGANTALFSRMAAKRGAYTVAFDIDPAAVDKAYRCCKTEAPQNLLPLVMDLMNPSPSLGWNLAERDSFVSRGTPDVVLALALVHHIAIGQNVPLDRIARFMASIAPSLVIEFVPKSDSQVQRMLATRKDIFGDYSKEGFERAFGGTFDFESVIPVTGSERTLYLMRRKAS